MAGMALGSWGALRSRVQHWQLLCLQIAAVASPLALYATLVAASGVSDAAGLRLASYVLFPALAIACGFLGGYQFPLAARVFFTDADGGGAGALYALDLAGACAGALLLSAYLVPVFGMARTAALIAAANLVPAALAGLLAWRAGPGRP